MSQESRLVPHPDAVLRRVGAGAVLVHLGSGRVFELNDTAARAWELAATGLDKSEVIAALLVEYAGIRDAVERDVEELFDLLSANGLITT